MEWSVSYWWHTATVVTESWSITALNSECQRKFWPTKEPNRSHPCFKNCVGVNAPYKPLTNGNVEQFHRTLYTPCSRRWYKFKPEGLGQPPACSCGIQQGVKTWIHRVFSELSDFGEKKTRAALGLVLGNVLDKESYYNSTDNFVYRLHKRQRYCYALARDHFNSRLNGAKTTITWK